MDISVFLRSALDISVVCPAYFVVLESSSDLDISVFLRSAMDCSSDESSELSETDIDDYAEKSYLDLKAGQ